MFFLTELLSGLIEDLFGWIHRLCCKHEYHSGWKDIVTGESKKVCYKCNKIVPIKGGLPKLDTPILSEEDVKDLND